MDSIADFAVIGAGVFGAWTAHHLRQLGRVILLDAYGPGNSRASSGGESRIIRMGYGPDELYTKWSERALEYWQALSRGSDNPVFLRTGVLWLARPGDQYTAASVRTLQQVGVDFERLSREEIERRFPQFSLEGIDWALLEPGSGVLLAREAVQRLVKEEVRAGVQYLQEAVVPPVGTGRLQSVKTQSGATIRAGAFVFACGPWLPVVFPELLRARMFITRQEVFFFGAPAGTEQFAPAAMPVWLCFADQVYGMPDVRCRGVKIAFDRHGPEFDPDVGVRTVTAEGLQAARSYLGRRFPQLADAPVLETRVCQYENTCNGDFLIDRHPDFENVWLVGGGSGHGFKHGPVVGEYAANLVAGSGTPEPRFSLDAKHTIQNRTVF